MFFKERDILLLEVIKPVGIETDMFKEVLVASHREFLKVVGDDIVAQSLDKGFQLSRGFMGKFDQGVTDLARDVGGITELVKALKHIVVGVFFKDHQIGESIVERFKEHLRVCGSGDDGRDVDIGKSVTVQIRELVIGHYGVEQLLSGLRQGMYFVDKDDGAS